MISRIYEGETAVICATGPSVTAEVISKVNQARKDGLIKSFGMNRAFSVFDLDLLHGCNTAFWDYYWGQVKDLRCDKWTTRPELEGKYSGLNYIEERWEDCLGLFIYGFILHHSTSRKFSADDGACVALWHHQNAASRI